MPGALPIEYQERDFAVLRELFTSRIMTLGHITALHFGGRSEAAKKRVQKLKAADVVAERPRKVRDPGILYLTAKGHRLLKEQGLISEYPALAIAEFERRSRVSDLTIRHELEVMDVKAAIVPAINGTAGMKVLELSTWPLLHEFDVEFSGEGRVRVRPDGLMRVEEKGSEGAVYEHTFFLEVDRGTETLDTLSRRSLAYREHYSSGGYAVSLGAQRRAFADFPFRVLIVLPSDERRNNLAECLLALRPPIETQVWLTTSAELKTDPLGSVWVRPRDYRDAMLENSFLHQGGRGVYRRQPARDAHVRRAVRRVALFSN
jgi:hypothetical protein